jgi:hypothetical protein
MRELKWSSDLQETVIVQNTLTAEEAVDILCRELLGEDYYIADPVGGEQANAIIVRDILSQYQRKQRRFW